MAILILKIFQSLVLTMIKLLKISFHFSLFDDSVLLPAPAPVHHLDSHCFADKQFVKINIFCKKNYHLIQHLLYPVAAAEWN